MKCLVIFSQKGIQSKVPVLRFFSIVSQSIKLFTTLLFYNEQRAKSNEQKVTSSEQKVRRNKQVLISNEQKLASQEQRARNFTSSVTHLL